jgi:hypothetical protein
MEAKGITDKDAMLKDAACRRLDRGSAAVCRG